LARLALYYDAFAAKRAFAAALFVAEAHFGRRGKKYRKKAKFGL